MSNHINRTIVVFGATGRQGGAASRHLHRMGFRVIGVTRKPEGVAARALADSGIEVAKADLDDADSVERVLDGAYGVFLVTNFWKIGVQREIEQGRRLVDIAKRCNISHLVYSSTAAADCETGVPQIESKWQVEQYLRASGLPHTVVRPNIFMEIFSDPEFVPPLMWGMLRKVVGSKKRLKWIAVDDVGAIICAAFADPEQYLGRVLSLATQSLSIDDCARMYERVRGQRPRSFWLPVGVIRRLVSRELVQLWEFFRDGEMVGSISATQAMLQQPISFTDWLQQPAA